MKYLIQFLRSASNPPTLILLAVLLISIVVVAPIILMTNALTPEDRSSDVEFLEEVFSPEGESVARYVIVSGGGAAGYVYHLVNVQQRSEAFDPKQGVAVKFQGGKLTELTWVNSSELLVMLEGDLTHFEAAKRVLAGSEIHVTIQTGQMKSGGK